jgi:tRNA A-37 threonylcarbamoyl transferase component Bud32
MQYCKVTLAGSLEVKVVRKGSLPKIISSLDEVPISLLELDSKLSLFAENLIGLFLLPYELKCNDESFKEHLNEVINGYRERVVLEQAYDLYARLGPLLEMVHVRASYFPISRISLLWKSLGCLFRSAFSRERELLERLDELYIEYAKRLFKAETINGGRALRLRPPRIREMFTSFMASFKLSLQSGIRNIAFKLPKRSCEPPEVVRTPWLLLSVEEGELAFSCPPPKALIGGSCKAPSVLSESLVCEGKGIKVAVKDYYRLTMVKWIPATLASQLFGVKYRLGAKSRMAAEVKYLPLLRTIIRTPKILKICADYGQAYIVREYIEGTPLNKVEDESVWEGAGEALAEIHQKGFYLGDPNPGNFVVDDDLAIWLVDAEQARANVRNPRRHEAWDVLVFLVYSLFLDINRRLLRVAMRSYAESRGDLWGEVKKYALRPQVWASLGAVAPSLFVAQKIIKET